MKITKMGILPEDKEVEMQCKHCGCVFQALQKEFKFVPDQRDGNFWTITCPTENCNETLYKYSW